MYKAQNGTYPIAATWSFQGTDPSAAIRNQYIPGIVPSFTSNLPISNDTNAQYCYLTTASGSDYKLIRYRANGIPTDEWKQVPDSMKDSLGQTAKDRYGYWSDGGAALGT
jgi:hypothetical protein